jgi:UDP-galactopyranose mutase
VKILIVGAGLSGCTSARLLVERGHDVTIFERDTEIGGLCKSVFDENGFCFEVFGPHTFHSSNAVAIDFVKRFADFNGHRQFKGMIIEDQLYPFPLSLETLKSFSDYSLIMEEISKNDGIIDKRNFETACLSVFGKTLYNKFIKNYTQKMWGEPPCNLSAEWAPKRLRIDSEGENSVFGDEWQGLPIGGYSAFISRIIDGISVHKYSVLENFDISSFDVVAFSGRIDEYLNFQNGSLPYRSSRFYNIKEDWECKRYGSINLPDHQQYIRKCNFTVMHGHNTDLNLVQYQESTGMENGSLPMYPISMPVNEDLFQLYLEQICTVNVCPIGRLGLYKYFDMDEAILCVMEMISVIEEFPFLDKEARVAKINNVRQKDF